MNNKKVSRNSNNNNKITFVLFISLAVFLICAFFVSLKHNFHFDELCSYGLANNQFQMLVDDYKVYSGDELVKNYLSVHEGNQFDFANLFFNQANDTHPILWYSMLHIICSIFVGTFSKWYGLIINCIFMIFVYWFMRHLLIIVTKNKSYSTIVPIMCLFLNGFINAIVFVRMYIVLEAVSLAFVCLLIDKMLLIRNDKDIVEVNVKSKILNIILKEKFYILFIVLTILGTLTQYHYMVMGLLMSIVFGIFLLKYKKYLMLIKSIISGIIGLVISYIIFPPMLNHIFINSSGLHSLGNVERDVDILYNFTGFFIFIRNSFFGNNIIFIIMLIVITIISVISFMKYKSNSHTKDKPALVSDSLLVLLILTIISIAYYAIISLTATYVFSRYVFNIYPIISILLFGGVYLLLCNINIKLKYLSLLFVLICIVSSNIKLPVHLYYERKEMGEFMKEHKDIKAVMAYYENDVSSIVWKLPDALYDVKDLDEVVFVNVDKENWQDNDVLKNNQNLFVFVYVDIMSHKQYDDVVVNRLLKENNLQDSIAISKTPSVHLYMLY